ncbi:MAG TPA: acylphosphatase [bacterium]|nr:acylphosphatase [bacterium]
MSADITVELIITGVVQGVGFRWFVEREAGKSGLSGFVKNRDDGSVLVRARGDSFRIEQFMERIKAGPSHAIIEGMKVHWGVEVEDEDFHIAF